MSDQALDIRDIVARIDRNMAEADKFRAEQQKLYSERDKFDRDRWIIPLVAILGGLGPILGVVIGWLLRSA